MFPVYKLDRLPAGQRRRKLIALFLEIEKTLPTYTKLAEIEEYIRCLVKLTMGDPKLDIRVQKQLVKYISAQPGFLDILRTCNYARHGLLAASGTSSAEWDLVMPSDGKKLIAGERQYFPDTLVFVEDIRSPFNLGSIFRTAEAYGLEKVLISPLCVSPLHPRSQRSAMGCIDLLSWEQKALDEISQEIPVFALETGGTPLNEFQFPIQGVVLVGSEELGLSPEALSRSTYGRVSIPMKGIKASLNVGVAFGILMQAWSSYLTCSDSNPF